MNLKSSVESRKAALALGAPDKTEKDLITNQVNAIFSVSPGTPMSYTSFSRSVLDNDNYRELLPGLTDTFIYLLSKKQTYSAYALFTDYPKLQDELKPVYYALMTLLKDEYPKEYLKMGDELEVTVSETLTAVDAMRKKYS